MTPDQSRQLYLALRENYRRFHFAEAMRLSTAMEVPPDDLCYDFELTFDMKVGVQGLARRTYPDSDPETF